MPFLIAVLLSFSLNGIAWANSFYNQPSQCGNSIACECPGPSPGGFSVCAEDSIPGESSGGGSGSGSSMRECKYFANGTIDVPTLTVITAWVPVGSRLCIGDEVPEPSSSSGSWRSQEEIELRDKFTAFAAQPTAWWSPGGEVEYLDPIALHLEAQSQVVSGTLLGKAAQIRFRPVFARWEISNGQNLVGFHRTHSFEQPGSYSAQGYVAYEVDYKYASANWVLDAAEWELASDKLTIRVIARERRTLLVG